MAVGCDDWIEKTTTDRSLHSGSAVDALGQECSEVNAPSLDSTAIEEK